MRIAFNRYKSGLLLLSMVLLLRTLYYLFYCWAYGHIAAVQHAGDFNSVDELFARNDWGWYRQIARAGYPIVHGITELGCCGCAQFKQSEWAFFPLYPALVAGTMQLLHLEPEVAAFALSLLFAWGALWVMYSCCLEIFQTDEKQAVLITLFFALLPFNYYLHVYYTEALFFTLLGASFLAVKRKQFWLLSLLTAMLVVTRPNGLVTLLPIAMYLFFQAQAQSQGNLKVFIKRSLWLAAGPLAFGLYCLYQHAMTGQYFAFSVAQIGWCRSFKMPYYSFFRDGSLPCQFNSIYTLVVLAYWIFNFKKVSAPFNALIAVSLLLPLCTGSVQSMSRFIPLIFPLVFMVASKLKHGIATYLLLACLFALQLWSFYYWIIADPLSY